MAGWWSGRLMCVEMTSGGGRAQLLSNIVERWPGHATSIRANATGRRFSRAKALCGDDRHHGQAVWQMELCAESAFFTCRLCGFSCGPIRTTRRRVSGRRFVRRPCRWPAVWRGHPVPNLADRLTEPGDLARSPFFQYRFTLGGSHASAEARRPCVICFGDVRRGGDGRVRPGGVARCEEPSLPVLLDFYADWCGPCQGMRPAVDQLAREGYDVRRVNVDQAPGPGRAVRRRERADLHRT